MRESNRFQLTAFCLFLLYDILMRNNLQYGNYGVFILVV